MPRSETIWILIDRENTAAPVAPVAAFTVRREMKTWLDRNRWQWDQLRLFKMKDRPSFVIPYRSGDVPTELDIREVMK